MRFIKCDVHDVFIWLGKCQLPWARKSLLRVWNKGEPTSSCDEFDLPLSLVGIASLWQQASPSHCAISSGSQAKCIREQRPGKSGRVGKVFRMWWCLFDRTTVLYGKAFLFQVRLHRCIDLLLQLNSLAVTQLTTKKTRAQYLSLLLINCPRFQRAAVF